MPPAGRGIVFVRIMPIMTLIVCLCTQSGLQFIVYVCMCICVCTCAGGGGGGGGVHYRLFKFLNDFTDFSAIYKGTLCRQ